MHPCDCPHSRTLSTHTRTTLVLKTFCSSTPPLPPTALPTTVMTLVARSALKPRPLKDSRVADRHDAVGGTTWGGVGDGG